MILLNEIAKFWFSAPDTEPNRMVHMVRHDTQRPYVLTMQKRTFVERQSKVHCVEGKEIPNAQLNFLPLKHEQEVLGSAPTARCKFEALFILKGVVKVILQGCPSGC